MGESVDHRRRVLSEVPRVSILIAALSRGLLADYVMGERVDRRVMVRVVPWVAALSL